MGTAHSVGGDEPGMIDATGATAATKPTTIMVVDDPPKWRDGVSRDHTENGFEVVATADSVAAATSRAAAEPEQPCVSRARKTPTPIKTTHPARTDLALSSGLTELAPATGSTVDALTFGLAAERITGIVEPIYVNADMQRGHDEEPRARDYYTEHHAPATEYGFMVRELDDGTRVGFSPDGIVGDDGLIEVKAPRQKTHLRTILAGSAPVEHMAQMQCGMWVSGRDWCDFISFYGGMPVFVERVHASTEWATAIEAVARRFEQQVADITNDYTDRTASLPITEPRQTAELITF